MPNYKKYINVYIFIFILLFLIVLLSVIYHYNNNTKNKVENLYLGNRLGLKNYVDRDQKVNDYNSGLTEYTNFKFIDIPYQDKNFIW